MNIIMCMYVFNSGQAHLHLRLPQDDHPICQDEEEAQRLGGRQQRDRYRCSRGGFVPVAGQHLEAVQEAL